MKIGFFGINMGPMTEREALVSVARRAEERGLESLWTGEHVVLPEPQAPPSPLPPHFPILDPAVALAHAAAVTSRIRLGTGIIILPQRNPVVLAKELATVDILSSGRLIFGIGIGYLEPEFRAIGAPFDQKDGRTREYLAAMRSLWEDDSPRFEGNFASFANVQQRPQPVQKPIPIVFGGYTPAGFRRAVELAHGWYGFGLDRDGTETRIAALREVEAKTKRPPELGRLEITITPPPGQIPDRKLVAEYERLGVDRLAVAPFTQSADEVLAVVDRLGDLV